MLLLQLAVPALAQHTSEDQRVAWETGANVLDGIQIDTGYWPSPSDPLAIRLYVTTAGGVQTSIDAVSELEWTGVPGRPMSQRVVGGPDGGWLRLDSRIDIGADVQIDIAGVFTGVVPVAGTELILADATRFDPLLLPGALRQVEVGAQLAPVALSYAIPVIPTVDLVVGIEVTPDVRATLSGVEVHSEARGTSYVQAVEGQWSDVAPNPEGAAQLGVTSTWIGDVETHVDLVLSPELSVFTPLGTFTLARFDIPVPVKDRADRLESNPAFYVHPLPVLDARDADHDFGAVEVGTLAVLELPLTNQGALLLSGDVVARGDGAFTVFPDAITAGAGSDDGLVVVFAPDAVGPRSAEIVLHTNDPAHPEHVLRVLGQGVLAGDGDAVGGPRSTFSTCGCTSGAPAVAGWGWLVLLFAAVRRRSR